MDRKKGRGVEKKEKNTQKERNIIGRRNGREWVEGKEYNWQKEWK